MWWHVLRTASSLAAIPLLSSRMMRGCFGIVYKARFRSFIVKGNCVGGRDVLMRYSTLWLFQVSGVGNDFFNVLACVIWSSTGSREKAVRGRG